MLSPWLQELIVQRQVHLNDRHVGHRRQPLACADQAGHGLAAERFFPVEQEPQGLVDSVLAFPRREVEDLQVVLDRAAGPLVLQDVISHAESTGGKHRVAVVIALERARLPHQPVDEVAVLDPSLAPTAKPR
jgi:hypothetical protein